MPALPPRFGPFALLLLPALAACGLGDETAFAPSCPQPVILRDAGDLHRFRGAGRDLTDTVLEGRITGVSGSCKRDGSTAVAATVNVGMELTRGPAAQGRAADVAFFVAVSEGERVLDKQVYTLQARFPENTDRVRLTGDSVDLLLPVSRTKDASAYRIVVGFQLTPAELEMNRQMMRR